MNFRILKTALILVCAAVLYGCADETIENKKNLMVAIDKFYTAVLNENLDQIYDYFPEDFRRTKPKEEFLDNLKSYPKQDILAAFSLIPISKYEIISVQPLIDDRYEVTVAIYAKNPPQQMKDIMIWKLMSDGSWKNVSYSELVGNLLKTAADKQQNALKSVLELKKCKNHMQELILALWEYCSQKNITYAEFNAVPKDKWVDLLKAEKKFLMDKVPSCPSGGTYTIKYDDDQQNLVVGCSKHQTVFIPYKFNNLSNTVKPTTIVPPASTLATESAAGVSDMVTQNYDNEN